MDYLTFLYFLFSKGYSMLCTCTLYMYIACLPSLIKTCTVRNVHVHVDTHTFIFALKAVPEEQGNLHVLVYRV